MKCACFVLVLLAAVAVPAGTSTQAQKPPAREAPSFAARLEEALKTAEEACTEMANNHLPLRDEQGRPAGPRTFEGFRPSVDHVRHLNQQLAASPADFVVATDLFLETGELADTLFDFSQTAYDNDREELGRRLVEISAALERRQQEIKTYTLGLAMELQQRVRKLEQENQDLQRRLDEALAKPKEKSHPQGWLAPRAAGELQRRGDARLYPASSV